VAVQGTVSPGASIDSLVVGQITFNATSIFDYETDSSAPPSAAGDQSSWWIDYTAQAGGANFGSDHIAGSYINITVVPEPSVFALLAIGALLWAGWARFPKRRPVLSRS